MVETASTTADRWLATLAGRNTWQESERELSAAARTLTVLQIVAIVATVSSISLIGRRFEFDAGLDGSRLATIGLVVVVALMLVGPVRAAFGRVTRSRSELSNVAVRASLGIAVTACIFAIAPGWWAMLSWPVGIAVGCDVALTTAAIGWKPSPMEWWRSVLLSPFHAGVVGGLFGATIASRENTLSGTALSIYATLHVWLGIACFTAWASNRTLEFDAETLDQVRLDTTRYEHRRSAHWLHDDICAQLRLVSLKVQSEHLNGAQVGALLDDLDFALRLRQLDELIESGTVRLAELLQPFLRNAQNHGVSVVRVPTYDVASTELDYATGQAFRRAAAVLTSNALNAGATTLCFDVEVGDDSVDLTVTDDAGGFDPSDITAGRGLWSLRHDLGDGNLAIEPTGAGSSVRATVLRQTRGRSNGTFAAGR